jgi:hypothetical protein
MTTKAISSKHTVRNAILLGAGAIFLTSASGCFGRFRAINAVHDFNQSASDNTVVRSLLMCAMVIIPVYEFAFLADALVLNLIEFFNGSGKLSQTETLPDGTQVQLARVDADTVRVRHIDATGREQAVEIVRVGRDAGYVRRAGRIVGTVERLPDGRLLRTGAATP